MMRLTQETTKPYLTTTDLFELYDNKYKITKSEFNTIINVFNAALMGQMIENGKLIRLPNYLGSVGIMKKRPPGKAKFDFEHYKQTGEKVWLKNYHSDSQVALFTWIKKLSYECRLPAKIGHIWEWVPTREYKRLLANKIFNENSINKYYDINDY